jgi:hypothetical protein
METEGGANKGCWAACLGDCGEGISREHWVSKCLFESEEILVQGFSWCLNEPKTIPLANFVAKILCKKHNSAISELDSAALQAFKVFRESIRINQVRGKLKRPPIWNIKRLTIDGPRLERWFLKTLINFSYDGQWTIGPGAHPAGTVSCDLVEIAFGRRQFENGSGPFEPVSRDVSMGWGFARDAQKRHAQLSRSGTAIARHLRSRLAGR